MTTMQTRTIRTDVPLTPWSIEVARGLVSEQTARNRERDRFVTFDPETHPVMVAERERGERRISDSKNRRPKLSMRDVYDIRERYDEGGETQAEIGADYGISQGMVSVIGRRLAWRGLPEQPARVAS